MQPKQSIAQVKSLLADVESLEDPLLKELAADPRKGVQAEIVKWYGKQEKIQLLKEHRQTMLQFEESLISEGYQAIAGVDEVGRGPLAGPVVAAAVILPLNMPALPINDSKKLSLKQRNELYDIIIEKAEVGIGLVDNHVIDSVNIYQATKLAMGKAVASLPNQPDALLIDAMKLAIDVKQVSLIKGDARSYSIAAASIVAKVYRDRLMADYAVTYPHYGFESNAGYGTKVHLEGLAQHGITPIHRHSFEPIKSIVKK